MFLDQAMYEELVRLEREGMRFYLDFGDNGATQVREFHNGFWLTPRGKKEMDSIHTTLAMFGSAREELDALLAPMMESFLAGLQADPRLGAGFAVAHGSGPGVMKAVDDAAARLGVFRFGVGIDGETLGQLSNADPEALCMFVTLALNTRQDILDRRSLIKIFNIGGFGTCYEINMALTFMKIGHCLPAPYIFVDPFSEGAENHIWRQAIEQFRTMSRPRPAGDKTYGPMGPAWVADCCRLVHSYDEAQAIIKDFVADPAAFWREAGVGVDMVKRARDNMLRARVCVPPYIAQALGDGLPACPESGGGRCASLSGKEALSQF